MQRPLLALLIGFLSASGVAFGQSLTPQYFLKPPDMQLPQGVAWGEFRRTIQPFENWTVICDENLKAKQRVCNISQIVLDRTGGQIFSWSLAATRTGDPFFLLRVPATINRSKGMKVTFASRSNPVLLQYEGCDASVCMAMMPAGPVTRENIDKGSDVTVSFTMSDDTVTDIVVPLQGLKPALSVLK
jgi:invasion protein IalB